MSSETGPLAPDNDFPDSYFFAADLHLGSPNMEASLQREIRFVQWLEAMRPRARAFYLLGDVFDFWFEYRRVVPKGFIRLLGKLAELSDAGIELHLFAGNHDLWYRDYLPSQMNIEIHFDPIEVQLFHWNFLLAHGDGLGPGDHGYKVLKKVLRSPFTRHSFGFLHPAIGIKLALLFSNTSRKTSQNYQYKDLGEREFLYQYALEQAQLKPHLDYLVFGHRHLAKEVQVGARANLLILGDWIRDFSYLHVHAEGVEMLRY